MKRNLLILLTLIITTVVQAQSDNNSIVVMELFTSQGCSSCPPADELLDMINEKYENDNVFVLSYHVDYWNRLGWKDPFSTEAFSDYQRDYAQQFNSRSIYTPQLVVNGSEHFTGSNSSKALAAIRNYSKSKTTNVIKFTNVERDTNTLKIDYGVQGDSFDQVTFALVVSERTTEIGRGENRNRSLKNTNIVASRLVKQDISGSVTLSIPDWIADKDELSVIAYTQDNKLATTGAARINI
ncbi:DUF1223 domain-containing protein [Aquimarina sp. MMG015]|uniref:DUF1223 domain-containing protein n=1 Tax=Aquimarina TaxID=290174 RepID=UPI0004898B60|nr:MULTISPECIES: DUF1223 domain-containing protein [Aquimarina]AXT55581.1 DUF1223 domain-containing protein [Aquimarina sp. AD1]MBQ4804354.1 DUF1223 domain-containing protein [Aquimarina sp. MMG015]RKN21673.1 DUF1223 domain-containing protein [Aquimarina sp. AD1]